MHILISGLYGGVIWFAAMAYALIVGGPIGVIALAGPLIISAGVAFITALDYGISKLIQLWRTARANARA